MALYHSRAARLIPLRIIATLIGISLFSITVILSLLIWTARAADELQIDNAASMVEAWLASNQRQVDVLIRDYADWESLYLALLARDDAAIFGNAGEGTGEGSAFDALYFITMDGELLYSYGILPAGISARTSAQIISLPYIRLLAESPPSPFDSVSGFVTIGGRIGIFGVANVQPEDTTGLTRQDMPVMVAGRWLDETIISALTADLMLQNVSVIRPFTLVQDNQTAVDIYGPAGEVIARIAFDKPNPGRKLLRRGLPVVAALSALLLGTGLVVARASVQLAGKVLEMRNLARTDSLTGLLNRIGLEDLSSRPRFSKALQTGAIAMLYIDIDAFKPLNDTFGHDAGDAALKVMAERLLDSVREKDIVARVGGDEFICVLFDRFPGAAAAKVSARALQASAQKMEIGDNQHQVLPSIGQAVGIPGDNLGSLIRRADIEMYRVKKARKTALAMEADSEEDTLAALIRPRSANR